MSKAWPTFLSLPWPGRKATRSMASLSGQTMESKVSHQRDITWAQSPPTLPPTSQPRTLNKTCGNKSYLV